MQIPSNVTQSSTTRSVGDDTGMTCPQCGSRMKWRQNKSNLTFFMGCVQYPACFGSRNEEGVASMITNVVNEKRLARLLKAAVMSSEDECLTFKESDLVKLDELTLDVQHIREEDAYVITVKPK